MPEIIGWKEAKDRGLKRYFTGKPCRFGNIDERRVKVRSCCCLSCSRFSNAKSHNTKERWRLSRKDNEDYKKRRILAVRKHAAKDPEKFSDYKLQYSRNYYLFGSPNPKGELQWLSKAKAMNRNLRRLIQKPNLDHSSWLRLDQET